MIEIILNNDGLWQYQPINYNSCKPFSPVFKKMNEAILDAIDFGYCNFATPKDIVAEDLSLMFC